MILVTGASGNVGSNVVRQLLEEGEKVRVITRNPSGQAFPDQVEVATGDLTQPETLAEALSGIERAFLFPVLQGIDDYVDALTTRVGKTAEVLPTVEQVTGRPPFTYAQWVADHTAAFGTAST